jgi:transcriptional regulator of acetoin/glycerol metabolism
MMLTGEIFAHAESILRLVQKSEIEQGQTSRLVRSWLRSLNRYGLDPSISTQPRILTRYELHESQTPLERFLAVAKRAVQRLHERVREAGYVVLLTDARGVTVDYLENQAPKEDLIRAGLYLGACWPEAEEGTNGIGTCIEDIQAITVHKSEHFRAPHATLTCSGAPILSPQGNLLAVLDASALYSPDEKASQSLLLKMVIDTAKLIEHVHFIDVSRDRWLLRLSRAAEYVELVPDCMLAVNETGGIVLSTCDARDQLQIPLQGMDLATLLGTSLDDLLMRGSGKCPIQIRTADGEPWYVQIRGPDGPRRASRTLCNAIRIHLDKFAGNDPELKRVAERACRLIHVDLPFVLHGESGCGKERFAHALHLDGPRSGKPFVTLNCATIPESLIESELFGYREGAFTGAKSKGMQGKVILADGGTLFLDEIGDMPLSLQSRLLRVLSEREVLPLAADKAVKVDVRVICASHRDLREMVRAGLFREDLFYRVSGAVIHLPAVRERRDLPELIDEVLAEEISATGIQAVLSPQAKKILLDYNWPGNLREMHHVLRYALSLSEEGVILPKDLPQGLIGADTVSTHSDAGTRRARLEAVLRQHGWCIESAAKELGVARSTLYRQMDRLQIVPPNRGTGR